MKKTAALLVVGLILSGCSTHTERVSAPASAGSNITAITSLIGNYQPVSDVSQHAKISEDICDINGLLDANPIDFAAIAAIYRKGKHSVDGDGSMRTLNKFAAADRSAENMLGRYQRYFGKGWLDAFARAAIDGTTAFAAEADLVRRQGVQKGVRDQIMIAWVFHELDAAVEKAIKGNFDAVKGAPHNWDEVRAYYHGTKPECAPYATAEERGAEFRTGSSINAAMREGLTALLSKDAGGAAKARDEVVRNITITYLQSAIKYSAKIDAALEHGKMDEARIYQAEGWAYFRVIEPLVADVNPAAAQTVAGIFDLKAKPAKGSGKRVGGALAKTYDGLGVRAAEVGEFHRS